MVCPNDWSVYCLNKEDEIDELFGFHVKKWKPFRPLKQLDTNFYTFIFRHRKVSGQDPLLTERHLDGLSSEIFYNSQKKVCHNGVIPVSSGEVGKLEVQNYGVRL